MATPTRMTILTKLAIKRLSVISRDFFSHNLSVAADTLDATNMPIRKTISAPTNWKL